MGKFIRQVINNDFAFIVIKISFSLIIGLIGSAIVLTNINQFAFYNYILSQGAPTPESGFKYIEFFVVILSIFLSGGSILFALLLTIMLAILDVPDRIASIIIPEKMPYIFKSIIGLSLIFLIVSVTVILAGVFINFLPVVTGVATDILNTLTNVFEYAIFWLDRSQIGVLILLIVSLYILVLIFRPQSKIEDLDAEINNSTEIRKIPRQNTKRRSTFAKVLLFLVPLLFNSALLVYVGWTLKEPARYGELLRSIRHGGNMQVYFCFDDPAKYGVSFDNCGNEVTSNGEPSILIGHTDAEVIWRGLKSPDIYVTKSSEIKSFTIKAGESVDTLLSEEFIPGGDVPYVPILERADLQKALMVLLPGWEE